MLSASKLCQSSSIVGPLGDLEAHVGEDGHDLVGDLAHRMDAAFRPLARRQGDVEALGGEPIGQGRALELGLARRQRAPRPRA